MLRYLVEPSPQWLRLSTTCFLELDLTWLHKDREHVKSSRCAGLYVCFCPCLAGCDIVHSLDEYTMLLCCCPNVPQVRSKLRYYGRIHVCFMPEPSNWLDSAWTVSCSLLMRFAGLSVRRQLLLDAVPAVRRVSDARGAQEDGCHEGARRLRPALPVSRRQGVQVLSASQAVVPLTDVQFSSTMLTKHTITRTHIENSFIVAVHSTWRVSRNC